MASPWFNATPVNDTESTTELEMLSDDYVTGPVVEVAPEPENPICPDCGERHPALSINRFFLIF